jgi:3-dehydroquinate synthase
MKKIVNEFRMTFDYPVYFTEDVFSKRNFLLTDILKNEVNSFDRKILFVIDNGLLSHYPDLITRIKEKFAGIAGIRLCDEFVFVPGGEQVKNRPHILQEVLEALERNGICRHSYLAVIGGGAVLDMAGFAAAICHRGVRHLRFPTTVLSQNDSGIGVKNGINAFSKKNFLGSFAPPHAVINDSTFLKTLSERDWRSGISEALKVALIKDQKFYYFIQENVVLLNERDKEVMNELIFRCAELHMNHISSGDPFEKGSSRPLDFGHWSAHKLEQLTKNKLRHGEAVAIGIAIDATISWLSDLLAEKDWAQIINLLKILGFQLYIPELSANSNGKSELINGLEEFREHLGGALSITLLRKIGEGVEMNEINPDYIRRSVEILKELETVGTESFLKKNIL